MPALNDIMKKYTLIEKIKSGCMATVFKGTDPEGNQVAVKVDASPESCKEAYLNKACQSPHVVFLFDAWVSPWYSICVMPYLSMTLHEFVQGPGMLDDSVAHDFCLQLAEGVCRLHSLQILHRDLHSANVMMTDDRTCLQIIDFGRATELPITDRRATIYSVPYRPPEILFAPGARVYRGAWQQGSQAEYGFPADIWAMACIMCVICSGYGPQGYMEQVCEFTCARGMIEMLGLPDLILASQNRWTFFDDDSQWKHLVNTKASKKRKDFAVPASLKDVVAASLRYNPGMRPLASQVVRQLGGACSCCKRAARV